MSELLIETGVSFASTSERWMAHKVALDADYVVAHLEEPALSRFDKLSLMQKTLVVRAITEMSVAKFRSSRKDPDYNGIDYELFQNVIHKLIGDEGLERLGL